jgi:hypothetical protein
LIEPVLAMRNKLMASGGTAAAQGVSAPEWWSATTARINAFKAAETGLATAIAGQIDELTAEKYSDLVSVLGWSVLCIAAITLITILVARSVIRPLRAITRVLDAINRGEEGLAAPMGLPDRSEIGKIANAMSLFRENAIERRKMEGTALAIRQNEIRRQTMLETILRKYRERMAAIAAGLERETGDMRAAAEALLKVASKTMQMADTAAMPRRALREVRRRFPRQPRSSAPPSRRSPIKPTPRRRSSPQHPAKPARAGGDRKARRHLSTDRHDGRFNPPDRGTDQSPGAERDDGGSACRRGGARLCGRCHRGEGARRADCEGNRIDHGADELGAGVERRGSGLDCADRQGCALVRRS